MCPAPSRRAAEQERDEPLKAPMLLGSAPCLLITRPLTPSVLQVACRGVRLRITRGRTEGALMTQGARYEITVDGKPR